MNDSNDPNDPNDPKVRAHRAPAAGQGRTFATVLCVAIMGLVGACQQRDAKRDGSSVDRAVERPAAAIDPADAVFGYTDDTGSRLLMLTDDGVVMDAVKARAIATAVCSEGREIPIRYLHFQKRTPESNGRQSARNLVNDEGHLFEIAGAPADAGDTCLLVPSNYLKRFPVARNDISKEQLAARLNQYRQTTSEADSKKQPLDLTPFQPTDAFARESIARVQQEKGRPVKLYWPLYSVGAAQQVAAVEFNAVGDSLLGSVVLAESGRVSFFDMPASLKALDERGGCWRLDDGCRFRQEQMDVPAVLGAPGEQVVFFTTWEQEGQLAILLQARAGKLVELRRAYRYHLPT